MLASIVLFIGVQGSVAIDSNDFLNANYLPYTLMLESSLLDNATTTNENITANGDMNNALNTMTFHRSKLNEYLCRNFIAKEILEEFGLQGYEEPTSLGSAAEVESRSVEKKSVGRDDLLEDVGSDNYKKWLAKSTILDDIYKHYNMQPESSDNTQMYASGEVTGYAIQSDDKNIKESSEAEYKQNHGLFPANHYDTVLQSGNSPEIETYPFHHTYDHGGSQHGSSFEGHSSPGYGGGGGHHSSGGDYHHDSGDYHHPTSSYHHHHYDEEKGLALKDLFDLALTALAFLAFGMFVFNLIMSCFAAQQGTTVVMQMTTDGGDGTAGDNTKRTKRNIQTQADKLNQLSYYVLNSIDSLIMLQHDKNQERCLKRSLCESNKYSRTLPTNQQIWVPVWSFGVSWISGKIINHDSRLENLRAIFLGLGKANCKTLYPKCDRNENSYSRKKEKG